MSRTSKYVLLSGVTVVAVALGIVLLWLNRHEKLAMARTRSESATGEYSNALRQLVDVRLPWHHSEVELLRSNITAERAKDALAWAGLRISARAMAGAATDRNGSGEIPAGVVADFANGLHTVLERPSTGNMTVAEVNLRLADVGLPKVAAVIVSDLRSARHRIRTVRFVVSNSDTSATGPLEDKNKGDCFDTGLTCWYFNAASSKLFVSVIEGDDVPHRVYEIPDEADDLASPGTFQGARLLDWQGGLALTLAGSYAASNGGNNGETWWHLWRLSHDGKMQFDAGFIPFKTGVDTLMPNDARGVVGKSFGEETTPFDECHACPHIKREFVATWNRDEGRYRVVSTRIKPSPYAALVRYIQVGDRGEGMLDATADLPRLRALKQFVNLEETSGTRCQVLSGDEYDLKGVVAEIRLQCGYSSFAVKAIRRGAEWSLSDAYYVSDRNPS